tara:strand:- start:1044 stop:2714 length:1671 start_codon:yes stop_codon:yes gene_type:complete
MKLIECVPNISEGRNQEVIDKITDTIKTVPGVHLLDVDPGSDTNRTVITFIGEPNNVIDAAYKLIKKASELIDMSNHKGEHARMGATDVCPLIPINNVSIKECIEYSNKLAEKVGNKLNIPIFMYEHSAKYEERKNLANIRKGEYEGMFKKIKTKEWKPDYGPSENNFKSGSTAIGVREFLIAYNINLNTFDKKIATDIALDIREAGRAKRDVNGNILRDSSGKMIKKPGKLKYCKAVGWFIDEYNQAQVSINLTNYKKTSIYKTFEEVRSQARKRGVRVTGSEIVGLIPLESLLECGKYYLKKQKRSTGIPQREILNIAIQSLGLSDISDFIIDEKVIEYKIPNQKKSLLNLSTEEFINKTSLGTPTPGGGSISALAGAFGMALSSMVASLSFQKKGLEKYREEFILIGEECQEYKDKMIELVELDTIAYDKVISAIRLPKKTESDIKKREAQIEKSTITAAEVPLEILSLSIKCLNRIIRLSEIGNPNSITDVGVALYLIYSAAKGASMNVIINANDLPNNKKAKYINKIDRYNKEAESLFKKIKKIINSHIND